MTFRSGDDQDLGTLPADVAELLARGSGHVDRLDPEVRARLRARLLSPALSGGGAAGGGPGTGAAPSAAKGPLFLTKPIALLVTTFALGMGSGAALHSWLRSGPTPAMAPSAQAPPPAVPSIAPRPTSEPAAPPSASSVCPAPPPRTPDRERETDRGLGRERALLDQARASLVGGDPGRALAALDRHRRLFPEGHLEEERDVLRVRALLGAGRTKEAQTEAGRFLRKHPASLFRPAVEEAIAEPPAAE
jgi:hypothetical protein